MGKIKQAKGGAARNKIIQKLTSDPIEISRSLKVSQFHMEGNKRWGQI